MGCRACAEALNCRLATIGILPTILAPDLLNSRHMSNMVRHQALNDRILALRDGAPLRSASTAPAAAASTWPTTT